MNPILRYAEMLTGPVRAELEQLVAAIRTGWRKQHNLDGTHGAITADSIEFGAPDGPALRETDFATTVPTLDVLGDLFIRGQEWDSAGDTVRVRIGGSQHGVAVVYGGGLKLCTFKSGASGSLGANSMDAIAIDETTGKATFKGPIELETGVWDDLVVPAIAVNPTGLPSAMAQITDTAGWLGALLAPNTGTPICVFQFQLSHTTQLGRDVHAHVHFVKDDAVDVTGTVVWEASFRHLPLAGTASAWTAFAAGTLVIDPGDNRNKSGVVTWTLANSTYNFGISDIIVMVLRRNGGTSGDAVVVSGDLHFERVRLGSASESSL